MIPCPFFAASPRSIADPVAFSSLALAVNRAVADKRKA
jgi:hypothetical protein